MNYIFSGFLLLPLLLAILLPNIKEENFKENDLICDFHSEFSEEPEYKIEKIGKKNYLLSSIKSKQKIELSIGYINFNYKKFGSK